MRINGRKIGRNETCHCGSNKKYKNCCEKKKNETDSQETPSILSIYQLITFKYFSENHIDIENELDTYKNLIFDTIVKSNNNQIKTLKNYIVYCEELIKEIAVRNTTYNMIFWARRLAPLNIFEVADHTVMLYREVQSLSFYKYGQLDNNTSSDGLSTFPNSLSEFNGMEYVDFLKKIKSENLGNDFVNILTDVIHIEILSFLFIKGTQMYRMASKGANVKIDDIKKNISMEVDEELSFLIDLYDERLQNTSIFSMTGTYIDDVNHDLKTPIFCPHFNYNVDHKIKVPIFNPKNSAYKQVFKNDDDIIEFEPNYLLVPLNIKNVYNFLVLFEDEFKEYYSFTVKEFMLFLAYVGLNLLGEITQSIDAQIHIFNRAYKIVNYDLVIFKEGFVDQSAQLHKNIFESEIDFKIDVDKILNAFILKKSEQSNLDLWTRGPKRFFYQISDSLILADYSCLTNIVSYIVKEITTTDGDIGNRRAVHFEEMLVDKSTLIFGKNNLWVCRNRICANGFYREIDASFIINDILFVLEAKAVNVSFGYDKGDMRALEFRKGKMEDALKESDDKVNFIKEYLEFLTPSIPKKVKFICPIVVSSNSEYIWSKSETLFISEDFRLPRIITINELNKLKEVDFLLLKRKNWVIPI